MLVYPGLSQLILVWCTHKCVNSKPHVLWPCVSRYHECKVEGDGKEKDEHVP